MFPSHDRNLSFDQFVAAFNEPENKKAFNRDLPLFLWCGLHDDSITIDDVRNMLPFNPLIEWRQVIGILHDYHEHSLKIAEEMDFPLAGKAESVPIGEDSGPSE